MRGIWLTLLLAATLAAQPPAFETASVKPTPQGRTGIRGGPGTSDPERWTAVATLETLLMRAYRVKAYQIAGPRWIGTERYAIAAKVPPNARESDLPAMLQSLLAERFRLKAHSESRMLPVYALKAAKSGAKLKEASPAAAAPQPPPRFVRGADGLPELAPGAAVARSYVLVNGGPDGAVYKLFARRETMDQLCDRLSAQFNRAVVDESGLKGAYDFTLAWSMEGPIVRTGPPPDELETGAAPVLSDAALSLFTALQRQLGLRLEARKMKMPVLVIDHLEGVPTEN